jgi:predicted kinase
LNQAEDLIAFGLVVIVDATFLKREQRRLFAEMAERMLVPFVILDMRFSPQVLRERIRERVEHGDGVSEADEGILDRQLGMDNHLLEDEMRGAVVVTEEQPLSISEIRKKIVT